MLRCINCSGYFSPRQAGPRKEQITAHIDTQIVYLDYDAFWRAHLGAEEDRFYLIPVPVPERPLALISCFYRRRTRIRMQFKSDVVESTKAAFRTFLIEQAD